jgi:2-oxoacid:acceptor oxidoreductase gamma subunit (pyruvate/2-ketoisovalerate family)
MIEVRFHGRGGQGTVLACDIMASAFLKEGKYGQSFPLFGGERRGAPVKAFLRVDDKRVLARGEIYEPDHVVVLDQALISISNVLAGLKKGGWVVINSPQQPQIFEFSGEFQVASVDANSIAAKYGLGTPMSRVVNTAILGALAKATGLVSLNALSEAIEEAVPARKKENVAAAREAYQVVRMTSVKNYIKPDS